MYFANCLQLDQQCSHKSNVLIISLNELLLFTLCVCLLIIHSHSLFKFDFQYNPPLIQLWKSFYPLVILLLQTQSL